MAQTVFESLDELRAGAGTVLGPSDWFAGPQGRGDPFPEANRRHPGIGASRASSLGP